MEGQQVIAAAIKAGIQHAYEEFETEYMSIYTKDNSDRRRGLSAVRSFCAFLSEGTLPQLGGSNWPTEDGEES